SDSLVVAVVVVEVGVLVTACPVVLVAVASVALLLPEQAASAKMTASSTKRVAGELPAPCCDRLPVSALTVLPLPFAVTRTCDPVRSRGSLPSCGDQRRRILHCWDDPGKTPVYRHEDAWSGDDDQAPHIIS